MRMITKMLAGAAVVAAAAPAAAQYYPRVQTYGYAQPYGYAQTYGYAQPYGYANAYGVNSNVAIQQCTAAVQNRLYNRVSLGSIIGSLAGIPVNQGRVLGVTSATQTRYGTMRVRGLASSGRYAYNNYSPYGIGAYGALGYNNAAAADLSFSCSVDRNGYVRDVNLRRR